MISPKSRLGILPSRRHSPDGITVAFDCLNQVRPNKTFIHTEAPQLDQGERLYMPGKTRRKRPRRQRRARPRRELRSEFESAIGVHLKLPVSRLYRSSLPALRRAGSTM